MLALEPEGSGTKCPEQNQSRCGWMGKDHQQSEGKYQKLCRIQSWRANHKQGEGKISESVKSFAAHICFSWNFGYSLEKNALWNMDHSTSEPNSAREESQVRKILLDVSGV